MGARKGRSLATAPRGRSREEHRTRKGPRKRTQPPDARLTSRSRCGKKQSGKPPRTTRRLIQGRIQGHPDGYAFLIPDDRSTQDVFLPRKALRPAMHGDQVLVRPVGRARRGRPQRLEGEVSRVLERGTERVLGVYRRGTRTSSIVPQDVRISYLVTIPPGASGDARDGDLVLAKITRHPTSHADIEARVVRRLGRADDPRVEADAIAMKYDLPGEFPPAVLREAQRVPAEVPGDAAAGRLDLRSLRVVTIDGENARDFDDAVGIEPLGDGGVRLTVAVADVAAYIRPGSALDREAAARGTSVYFPDRVIPMLPEALSNGICSLNAGVDRLVKVAQLDFTAARTLRRARFADAVIRSGARLTYTEVARVLVDRDRETRARHAGFVEDLERMDELCRALMEQRQQQGSVDFDLPEAEVILDLRGRPENILRAERTIAHRLIEEFMIAANVAVAREITARRLPMIYRVHEPPSVEATAEIAEFLEGLGLRLPRAEGRPTPLAYQEVLRAVAGRPDERLVNRVLLRSMAQARYAAENVGHFGLASPCYTHFTSPIRRYPDLVVHRILASTYGAPVSPDARERLAAALPAIAEEASRRERIAMDAERDIVALKKVQFMQDKVGRTFSGFVSDVTSFGVFVQLDEYFLEGLVHVGTLTDDFYEHDERARALRGRKRRRTIRIGDRVVVRIAAADVSRRRIDLVLEQP